MAFTDFQSFLHALEAAGELKRVRAEVDPELEITEIAIRSIRENRPAILFENVKGSKFPLAINTLASARRIEIGLGRSPEQIGSEIVTFLERINPPSPAEFWRGRKTIKRLLNIRPKNVHRGLGQQVKESSPDMTAMPALKCWPEDGGRFLTLPLVFSKDPENGSGNLGIYRMQVFGPAETGMHMQVQKGGGFHYWKAESAGRPLEMAVALGGDPALILSAIMALPEGIDEIAFSGIVRGKRTPVSRCRTVNLRTPANAEFILEGVVQPHVRRLEGPFGDHFGHYSAAEEFPVFSVQAITRRKNAVYPATVVGRPPQEDRYMGDATQQILTPFIRLLRKEVRDMWAYYEAGFHNLLVVSVETRYAREPVKTALGLLGEGQLSLTKCLVLVGPDVNPRYPFGVLDAIRRNFDPAHRFHLVANAAIDTLDFTGEAWHRGSKMIIDATDISPANRPYLSPSTDQKSETTLPPRCDPTRLTSGIARWRYVGKNALLVVQADGAVTGRELISRLVAHGPALGARIVAAVSPDVDIDDDVQLIWGIFTRFDPARDLQFTAQRFQGVAPVYSGVMGIDATWKSGYQKPLVMDPEIVRKVDRRWAEYWK